MARRKPEQKPLHKTLAVLGRTYWPQSVISLSLVLILALLFPVGKSLQYSFQLDAIAPERIIAPFNLGILKTEEKLKIDLEHALTAVPFIFKRNQVLVENEITALHEFFLLAEEIRLARRQFNQTKDLLYRYRYDSLYQEIHTDFSADSTTLALLEETFARDYTFEGSEETVANFLDLPEATGPQYDLPQFEADVLQVCRNRWAEGIYNIGREKIISQTVSVLQDDYPILAEPDDFQDVPAAKIKATEEIAALYLDEKDPRRLLWDGLIIEFMKPNLEYDRETTERRQLAAQADVERSQGTVLKDEIIIDANERVTEEDLQKLKSLALEISKRERRESGGRQLLGFLGRMILIGVVISFFFTFLLIYRTHIYDDWKMVLLISLIFMTELGLAHLIVIRYNFSEYLIPITVAAMILTILFDARIGFMGITSMALLTGIMIGNNLDFIVLALFISSVAVYNVRQLRTRSQLFTTIFALIGASILGVIGLGLFKGSAWETIGWDGLSLIAVNSILAPIITYGLIGLLEIAFGVTTDLALLELSDFNHPLLKRLQREANGTFNHSVVVGNLAEACATAIGARSLLCRVGAYYHDIGKMMRPEYFIENQFSMENKHNHLTPVMSAKIIRSHVKDGLELAAEYGLPEIVSDFIPMHHGTTRAEYFYRQALKEAENPDQIDEQAFKYPGPKPNTKETGILMICEAVEAAARSLKNPEIFKIEEMMDKILDHRIAAGQLNECPLTLDELRRIKGTVDGTSGMLPVLRGIYHIRIEYPPEEPETPPERPAKHT